MGFWLPFLRGPAGRTTQNLQLTQVSHAPHISYLYKFYCERKCVLSNLIVSGLFMILGVQSCRNGTGYCLLGLDCTLDDDFLPDDSGGHCSGLKTAFTPSAHFTCCKENPDRPKKKATKRPRPPLPPSLSSTTMATSENPEKGNSTIFTTESSETLNISIKDVSDHVPTGTTPITLNVSEK